MSLKLADPTAPHSKWLREQTQTGFFDGGSKPVTEETAKKLHLIHDRIAKELVEQNKKNG
ncbi:MAG: hypothetical protein WC310_03515 [Patescibacteria group bacterium]|jgi:hypothetical protein